MTWPVVVPVEPLLVVPVEVALPDEAVPLLEPVLVVPEPEAPPKSEPLFPALDPMDVAAAPLFSGLKRELADVRFSSGQTISLRPLT